MSCFNMGNERLFPNGFSAIELVLAQKHLSYLQNISMDLLNSSYVCLDNIFYDIYILQEFRRLKEEETTTTTKNNPAYSLNLISQLSVSFCDFGVFCNIDLWHFLKY